MRKVDFELINFQGEPAVCLPDGDVILLTDSLATFLSHIDILMNGEMPDQLSIQEAP